MFCHWLLSKVWQDEFSARKWEVVILIAIATLLYTTQVAPVVPLGLIKLIGLVILVGLPLWKQKGNPSSGILHEMDGNLDFSSTLSLLGIPLMASLVYGLANIFPPSESLVRIGYMIIYSLQALLGAVVFVWAWIDSLQNQTSSLPQVSK